MLMLTYDHFVDTLLHERYSHSSKDVKPSLNYKELKK